MRIKSADLKNESLLQIFISLIRMRSKRDIKMGRLCTPGGAVLEIVGGGVTFRFEMVKLFLTKICYFGYVYTLLWLS